LASCPAVSGSRRRKLSGMRTGSKNMAMIADRHLMMQHRHKANSGAASFHRGVGGSSDRYRLRIWYHDRHLQFPPSSVIVVAGDYYYTQSIIPHIKCCRRKKGPTRRRVPVRHSVALVPAAGSSSPNGGHWLRCDSNSLGDTSTVQCTVHLSWVLVLLATPRLSDDRLHGNVYHY
jgi:hypothetical protein